LRKPKNNEKANNVGNAYWTEGSFTRLNKNNKSIKSQIKNYETVPDALAHNFSIYYNMC